MATLTTPKYGFPYPDGAERVMDGDNAMGALATSVENILSGILGSLISAEARLSADQTLTSAQVNCAGATLSYTSGRVETVLVLAVFDFQVSTLFATGLATGAVALDGTPRVGTANLSMDSVGRATVVQAFVLGGVAAGAHTLQLQAGKNTANGVAVARAASTRMIVVRVPPT